MKFKGIGVAGDIIIGKAFLYLQESYTIPKYDIADCDYELKRFGKAVEKTKKEITRIRDALQKEISDNDLLLFNSFILFLEDEYFDSLIKKEIKKNRKNVEWVLYIVIEELVEKFKNLPNNFFAQRSEDISALGEKIMMNLLRKDNMENLAIPDNAVVISRAITPTDPVILQKSKIIGVVSELGGYASHTAILARGMNMSAVLGVEFITTEAQTGDTVIVNPLWGEVIVNPTQQEIDEAVNLQKRHAHFVNNLNRYKDTPSVMTDKVVIDILHNLEMVEELFFANQLNSRGIGLFRSEFLVLKSNSFPTEDFQYKEYKKIFDMYDLNKEITIRTIDLGGDKIIPGYASANEKNPFLGWRAIRFCLSRENFFMEQLRAILRAGVGAKNLKIMIPMVSTLEEILLTKEILKKVELSLQKQDIPYNSDYKFGIMFEIPSVLFILPELQQYIDFISIGTNDLIQYLLACDRGNEKVAYLFKYLNPSVLRFLYQTISTANSIKMEISVCGEMSSDIESIPLLIGMGLRRFSIPPHNTALMHKIVSSFSSKECEDLVDDVLGVSKIADIEQYVRTWLVQRIPDIFEY